MQLADPFYYLNNFQTMLEALVERDGDLLEAEEHTFIRVFTALPQRARALLVRMVMRKGSLFRASRLHYPEIACTTTAVEPLIENRWVEASPALVLDDLFALAKKSEITERLSVSREYACLPKPVLLETLRPRFTGARSFDEWFAACSDPVYRLLIDPLCERLRLMFFGNFRQHWSEFVLKDLGVFKFETIDLRRESRPFACRRHVEDFFRLYQCRQMLEEGRALDEIEAALPEWIPDCEWLEDRRQKLRFRIGRAYERAGDVPRALTLYADCSYPEARVRIQRIERRLGRGRAPRMRVRVPVPMIELALPAPAKPKTVERLVMEHLLESAEESTLVYFVENALINSLFGLLCWKAVFAPIPGAFFHGFHHGPADLESRAFVERRSSHFAECFAQLQSDAYQDTIRQHFLEKEGITSPFVAWGLLDPELLETALHCFPATHLAAWFEWIARDIPENRCGFPDIVQFWPRSRRYRLVEVKGPGDRLQENQRRCLGFCLSKSIPVSVCRVTYSKSTRE